MRSECEILTQLLPRVVTRFFGLYFLLFIAFSAIVLISLAANSFDTQNAAASSVVIVLFGPFTVMGGEG